jgi:aryl-alcohol dehydrogenase-like predicted oxidoreductase
MKLGLGTVDFATALGKHAFNTSREDIITLLEIAQRAGVKILDTALSAADSQLVLADCLPDKHAFNIVGRTPGFSRDFIMAQQADLLEESFETTLDQLGQSGLYALLIGYQEGLALPNGEKLFQRMRHLQAQQLIQKVGVSVSSPEEALLVQERWSPDIIQLPLNVLDQRAVVARVLPTLKSHSTEIHVRDAFLQGVLMQPSVLHPWFWRIRSLMFQYERFLIQEGLTPLEGALAFVSNMKEVDVVLVGAQSPGQLQELIAGSKYQINPAYFYSFACQNQLIINPKCWNLYE